MQHRLFVTELGTFEQCIAPMMNDWNGSWRKARRYLTGFSVFFCVLGLLTVMTIVSKCSDRHVRDREYAEWLSAEIALMDLWGWSTWPMNVGYVVTINFVVVCNSVFLRVESDKLIREIVQIKAVFRQQAASTNKKRLFR